MRNLKLIIQYEGTNYQGWQIQANGPTIQGVIEERLGLICGHKVRLIASGRTDSGVHALGQVANLFTDSKIELNSLRRGLNSLLPSDIVIKEISEVNPEFHSRYSARSRVYQYLIWNDSVPSPFFKRYSWWVHSPLRLKGMKEASPYLVGGHDFSSFSLSKGLPHSIREILEVRVEGEEKSLISTIIEANAFLKGMVRNIVGVLVEVGKGKMSSLEFKEILEAKKRTGPTAPPQGLFLKEVKY